MIREIHCIATSHQMEFFNITEVVQQIVTKHHCQSGFVHVRTRHTTTALFINEHEACLLQDTIAFLEQLLPRDRYYVHDDFSIRTVDKNDEYKDHKNGFAHLQAMLLGSEVLIPIENGQVSPGQWQAIIFLECDGPRRERTVEIVIINEQK